MKCKACNGTGKIKVIDFAKPDWKDTEKACPICCGSGVIEQTNDEWRKTCSTEEFAEFLFHIAYMCSYCGDEAHSSQEKIQQCHFGKCGCQRKDWDAWLKQPHTSQPQQKQDDYPCNVKGCSLETRQACCGCPDYFKWKEHHESR